MKNKTLAVAVLILAALCAVAYWFNRPPAAAPADPRVGQTVFDSAAVEKAAGLRIADQGKTVTLTRQSDGTWRDDSYFGAPADFSKLSGFVNDFTSAKVDRFVTANPDRIGRLDFGGTRVELLDAAGHPAVALQLGRNAETGGRFIRYGAEPKAYLATLNAYIDSDPKNWADAALVSVKADDVARLEVPFENSPPLVLTRAKKGDAWKASPVPPGEQLSNDKVAALLTSLTTLRFSDTSELGDPQARTARELARVYRLTTFDGTTVSIALGRRPEGKRLKPPAPGAPLKSTTPFKPGAKPAPPEYETIPAGAVYAFVATSDRRSPINDLMRKRAWQIEEYAFTGLPQKPADLLEPIPPKPKS
jgi:hypothetical protein